MSQGNLPTTSPLHDDDVPTSHQAEPISSPTTPDTSRASKSPQPNSEEHMNNSAEPVISQESKSSQQSSATINGVNDGVNDEIDVPENQDPAKEDLGNSKEPLDSYGWEELEQRFAARMEECKKNEEALGQEFGEWLKVFKAWASVTEVHEEERASKRLRTRIAFVQGEESQLETKRQHYVKVVKAFESALALLAE